MFKQIKFDKNRDIQSQTVDENDSCDEDDEDDDDISDEDRKLSWSDETNEIIEEEKKKKKMWMRTKVKIKY